MKRIIIALLLAMIMSFWGLQTPFEGHASTTLEVTQTATSPIHFQEVLHIAPESINDRIRAVKWISWSPDSVHLGVVFEDEHAIRILDAKTGKISIKFDLPDSTVNSTLAWGPDGKYLAGLFNVPENVIKIWSLSESSDQLPITIKRTGHDTRPIFWSPDGARLVSVDYSSEKEVSVLSIWDTKTGDLILSKDGMATGAWSPDGQKMVVYMGKDSKSSNLHIVDTSAFQILASFSEMSEDLTPLGYVMWMADSQQVVGTSCHRSGSCKLWKWNALTNQVEMAFNNDDVLTASSISVDTFSLNSSGKLLAISDANTIYLWNVVSGRFLDSLHLESDITGISWQPDGNTLALGGTDGSIQEWNVQYSG